MIKKTLSSKKGASSILVILLLIVLVVFGIAALTTALSSYRLGQKVIDWNARYYAVEAQAQQQYAEIDKAVSDAYEKDSADIVTALKKEIVSLGFDTDISVSQNRMEILLELWNDEQDLGLEVLLVHDLADEKSLEIERWTDRQ